MGIGRSPPAHRGGHVQSRSRRRHLQRGTNSTGRQAEPPRVTSSNSRPAATGGAVIGHHARSRLVSYSALRLWHHQTNQATALELKHEQSKCKCKEFRSAHTRSAGCFHRSNCRWLLTPWRQQLAQLFCATHLGRAPWQKFGGLVPGLMANMSDLSSHCDRPTLALSPHPAPPKQIMHLGDSTREGRVGAPAEWGGLEDQDQILRSFDMSHVTNCSTTVPRSCSHAERCSALWEYTLELGGHATPQCAEAEKMS